MSSKQYDVAQICLSGHVINAASLRNPHRNQKFCDLCGAETIDSCQSCGNPIRGNYVRENRIFQNYSRPAFCLECGNAYPWTQAALDAARELADELDELTSGEKELLKGSLDDIVRDTPRTPVAATKFKKCAAKAGKVAADGLKSILITVVTESAKKMLWL